MHLNFFILKVILLIFQVLIFLEPIKSVAKESKQKKDSLEVFEFKPGDILVRPNHNWFPNTGFVKKGNRFGHAAIVIKGAKGTNPEKLLSEILLFESHARDVPREYQLRKVKGYVKGNDYRFANQSFGAKYKGKRYLLRPNFSEDEINRVITYILKQENDLSSWRSLKNTSNSMKDKNYWYCSLLIYQAFKDVLNIDLDATGGLIVFPNDLIVHPQFDYPGGRTVF